MTAPNKRMRQSGRVLASLAGDKFYTGTPCGKCGNTERYVSNNGCRKCLNVPHGDRPVTHKAKATAKANGETFYEGSPCHYCQSTKRYVSTGSCVLCCKSRYKSTGFRNKKYGASRKAALNAGHVKYVGVACRVCGNTTRYTSNGNCVACSTSYKDSIDD